LWSESFEVWTLHPPIAPQSLTPTIGRKLSETKPDGKRNLSIMAINYLYFYTSIAVDCKNRSEKADKQNIKWNAVVRREVSGPDFSRDGKKQYNLGARRQADSDSI
jgi:hypothetical protein